MRFSITGCAVALILAATISASASQLAGSEWRPTEIDNIEVPADSEMFVRFDSDDKVIGHGGCNRFFGSYKIAGDRIEIGPLGATRMACPEPIMEREVRFLQALGNARQFVRERINLSLTDSAGNSVLRLLQTDAD